MPTLHIVRKVEVQFPLVDEEGRFIRGGHSSKQNAGAADCSVEKMAAAIMDDVGRSLSQHVHIPSGSHDSHVGDDGTKTTTATTAMHPNDTGTRPKPNPCNHEQIPWKDKAVPAAGKSVPRIEEFDSSQPESSLPTTTSLTSLRKYPSLCSKQQAVQTNTDDTVPIATGSFPPPTRLTKNVVTQDGIVGNAGAKMVLLPAADTSNASCSARAKRASFSALSGRIHPCDASNDLGSDDRASHLPPRKRLKCNNYTDALELLMKDKKAMPLKKKDICPIHTTLPQFPVTTPILLSESTETPRRIALCTEEECDMAAALMSLPIRTPSSPSNSSSPKSTTITDGASLLSSIHNMSASRPTGTDNNSGAAQISPASPTQPPLIFDIGAWFDQHQSGGRVKEETYRPHAEPRESQSSHSSSEDESSKKRNTSQGAAKSRPKYKDEDNEKNKCKDICTPAEKSLADVDDTCKRTPNSSPLLDSGKAKKHKRGNNQRHYKGEGLIPQHPHLSSKATKETLKHSSSDPSSFFPSRLRTLLECAEDDGLASVFSWQVRCNVCTHILI